MHQQPTALPLQFESPETTVRATMAGPMTMQCMEFAAGFDMTPLLMGLPDDLCQCPHWGYVLEGSIVTRSAGGPEYRIPAGELYYLAPGHTIRFDERTRYIDCSPNEAMAVLQANVQRRLAALVGTADGASVK